MEEKLFDLLKPYTEDQKTLVCLDNVFSALGIHKIDDINSLKDYFLPYAFCYDCTDRKRKDSLGEELEDGYQSKAVASIASLDLEEIESASARVNKIHECITNDHLIMIDSANVLEALREFATAHTNTAEESK